MFRNDGTAAIFVYLMDYKDIIFFFLSKFYPKLDRALEYWNVLGFFPALNCSQKIQFQESKSFHFSKMAKLGK